MLLPGFGSNLSIQNIFLKSEFLVLADLFLCNHAKKIQTQLSHANEFKRHKNIPYIHLGLLAGWGCVLVIQFWFVFFFFKPTVLSPKTVRLTNSSFQGQNAPVYYIKQIVSASNPYKSYLHIKLH